MAVTPDEIFNSQETQNALDNFEQQIDALLIRKGKDNIGAKFLNIDVPPGVTKDILNLLKPRYSGWNVRWESAGIMSDAYIVFERK